MSLFLTVSVWAQEKQIKGSVTSTDEEPLIGVTVMIHGTQKGTTTNFDGVYNLTVEEGNTLVFSYVGYASKKVLITTQSLVSVTLEEDAAQLDEIVVVGYGEQRKAAVSSAISTADGEDLRKLSTGDVAASLQGRVSGVQVSNAGAAPGESPSINIRGISTINNNTPLYVVDGAPVQDITFLSPKDIESIQVLKDASAAAIYGSRGSNGVIIVTTIKGETGKMKVSFDGQAGVQSIARTPRIADAAEYNRGLQMMYGTDSPNPVTTDTNWFNEVKNDGAPIQDYALNIHGGTETVRYNFSGNYFSQDGVLKGYDYERFTGRLGLAINLRDNLSIEQSLSVTPSGRTHGVGSEPWDAMRLKPTDAVYKPVDERQGLNEYSIYSPSTSDVPNIAGRIARNDYRTQETKTFSNTALNWEIIDGLKFKTQYSYYYSVWEKNQFSPEYFIGSNDQNQVTSVTRDHNVRTNYVWNNTLTYAKIWGKHQFSAMVGTAMERFTHKSLWASGKNVPSNDHSLRYPEAAINGFTNGGTNDINSLASVFGRVSYNYDDRYFITANFRADGSSKFDKENQWGFFPSVSGGWNISNEAFMDNADWLSNFKVRGGWGRIGNQDIANSAFLTTMRSADYVYGPDGDRAPGFEPNQIGNPALIWETVQDANVGIDLGFLNDKFTVTLDVFERTTSDMLMQRNVPPHLGYPGADRSWDVNGTIWSNVGSISTKGWDATIGYNVQKTDWSFGVTANLSQARATMEKMANDGEVIWDGYDGRTGYITRTEQGGNVGGFYGYRMIGIFQNQTQINSHTTENGQLIQPRAKPGDVIYADINGDGQITDEDREYIGDPTPDLVYGMSLNASYKNFDFNATFQGTIGNDLVNGMGWYTYSGGNNGNSNFEKGAVDRAWNGEGSTNSHPRLAVESSVDNFNRFSSQYIESGNFIRLQNIQLGYTFNQLKNVERLRIFVSAQNLFTISSYEGMDPDLSGGSWGLLQRGIDWGDYPTPRTIMGGINVSF